MSDDGPWRGISREEWVGRFVEEARVPTCPRCGHPWPFHKPDEERGGYTCRGCRCRRTHPPAPR